MKSFLEKTICLLLAGAMALNLAGCDLHMEMPVEVSEAAQASPTPDASAGQSIGQELADTYKADHIFSLNCVDGESFNPYTTNSHWNLVVSMLMYETLVNADSSFEAQPNLITGWQTDDGMHWTFQVDTSRMFHSGGHMTGADAVATLDQARYSDRYAKRFANVTGTGYLDEGTFTVTLSQPNWRFYELLTIPCVESGSGYDSLPSGTGPYKLNSRGTALTLDPNYPGARSMSLDTIHLKKYVASEDILQAFEDSYLDLVTNNPMDMSSLGYSTSNIIKYVDTTNMHYIQSHIRPGYVPVPSDLRHRQGHHHLQRHAGLGGGGGAAHPPQQRPLSQVHRPGHGLLPGQPGRSTAESVRHGRGL